MRKIIAAVLALVLTMAPGGILAVETKAEGTEPVVVPGQANWAAAPAGAAAIQSAIDEAKAIQEAAKTALTDGTCPACGGATVTWEPLPGGSTGTRPAAGTHTHYYIEGAFENTNGNTILTNDLGNGDSLCLLLVDAEATINGRFLFYANGEWTVNVMGTGTVTSKSGNSNGSITVNGASEATVNLYGGTFAAINNNTAAKAILYMGSNTATVNIWNDVVIGNATVPTATSDVSYNVNIAGKLNMYGGTIQNGKADPEQGYQSANLYVIDNATFNMYGGTIKNGYSTRGANIVLGSKAKVANIYGGTIENGYATSNGGGIYSSGNNLNIYGGVIQKNKSVYPGGGLWLQGTKTIQGAKITENESTASHGGNIFISGATADITLEASNEISKGKTGGSGSGGNIYVNAGAKLTVKCDLVDGHAYNAGNLYVDGAATEVTLDGATLSGGTIRFDSTLQTNGRVNSGTLILKNGVNCSGGVLFLDSATSKLHVDSSFSGDFTLWQNGAQAVPGTAVRNATCNGAFTGLVRNGNWAVAEDYWVSVGMAFDGTSGLKYPAQGVVYNGAVTPAASSQNAVDAYIAAMADEEVEVKPQYVMVDGNVNIGDAEVAIWAKGDITVSGTGTVYGVDRANDAYAANGGSITADGVTVAEEVTAGGRRYIALSDATVDANKYTFHRVETKLTNVTVNVANAGIYYKAEYQFDEIVKDRIASYGVNVNLEGSTKEGQTSSSDMSIYDAESHTLTAKSHGVYGIFKDTNLASTNKENGQIKLCGNPYLAIDTTGNMESSDCPEFTAAESTKMSLADAMEMANEKWEAINEEGKPMLKEFFTKWLEAGAWDAEWAAKLTNLIPAEA